MRFRGGFVDLNAPNRSQPPRRRPRAASPRIPYSTHPNINHVWFRATLTTHDALVMYKNHTPSETVATRTPGVEVRTTTIRTVSNKDELQHKVHPFNAGLGSVKQTECVLCFFESDSRFGHSAHLIKARSLPPLLRVRVTSASPRLDQASAPHPRRGLQHGSPPHRRRLH